MLKKVFRYVFLICGMLLGLGVSQSLARVLGIVDSTTFFIFTGATIFLFGIIFFIIYSKLVDHEDFQNSTFIHTLIQKVPVEEFVPGLILLLIALLLANALSSFLMKIEALDGMYLNIIMSVMIYLVFGYYGWVNGRKFGSFYKDKVASLFQTEANKRKPKTKCYALPKVFDTSVIIDGRINEILKTGFLEGDIIIPDFVMVELRHISDSSDDLKRVRGRMGLDILNEIKKTRELEIYDTSSMKEINKIPEVDLKLLKLAEILGGIVVTNDYNLGKVAMVEGVGILNVNNLSNSLKPIAIPGETMRVTPVKEGKTKDQSVAFLDDGTMIVVQNGQKYIGKTIDVVVTSVIQTAAGRMIFVKP